MAGVGPAPKDPNHRARRNKDGPQFRVVTAEPVAQPDLPTVEIEVDGELVEFRWPIRTVEWWRMWRDSPLSQEFTSTDWSELLDTALLHARYWRGDVKLAGELRLRVAKFGATPEDRLRLKIMFKMAGDGDKPADEKPKDPPPRYGGLRLAD
jgi:hypothetical protein